MIDDWLLSLIYAAWLAASTMPLGFMLGSSCSPCCGGCGVADGKPRTDPKDEGTWVPSGTWRGVGGVTWTFTANPGDESGETWFFYGSSSTSRVGGSASTAEQRDWGNICNWYSSKTTAPSSTSGLPAAFDKRATRLPPDDAVVHVYTSVSTASVGPQTVKNIYFWQFGDFLSSSEVTSTAAAHDSMGGAVFNVGADNLGTVNGGATFNDSSFNASTVNGGATFNASSYNGFGAFGTINDGATFYDISVNVGTVNDGGTFYDSSANGLGSAGTGTVNNGATFYDSSANNFNGTINGGATFNDSSINNRSGLLDGGIVNDGATFNNSSNNSGTVNGGATFNDSSFNDFPPLSGPGVGRVNGGATFNDAACSRRSTGGFSAVPCTRKFVAHPTDLPTCNGTAPDGCANAADTCGCG